MASLCPCLNYTCKVRCMAAILLVLLAAAIALLYALLQGDSISPFDSRYSSRSEEWLPRCGSNLLQSKHRFGCFPEESQPNRTSCEARGCCFVPINDVPFCALPSNMGYESHGPGSHAPGGGAFELSLQRLNSPVRYEDEARRLTVSVETQTEYRLRIKILDPENPGAESPVPKIPVHKAPAGPGSEGQAPPLYSVSYNTARSPFTFSVRRVENDRILFDTSVGALIFSGQYLELTTRLPLNARVYGPGKSSPLTFDSSSVRYSHAQGGKHHPFYLCTEEDGKAHGLMILNNHAIELMLHESGSVTYRALGGVFDFYFFLGPTPKDVVQQYAEAVGRPPLPPYWSLGLHAGLPGNLEFLPESVANLYSDLFLPVESFVTDVDLAEIADERSPARNFSKRIRERNQKLVFRLKPVFRRRDVLKLGSTVLRQGPLLERAFVTDKWGLVPFIGQIYGEEVLYPDFGSGPVSAWWAKTINEQSSYFDGLWLAENEPRNDFSPSNCENDEVNRPPYTPGGLPLSDGTLCMDSMLHWRDESGPFYRMRGLYGHAMLMATAQTLEPPEGDLGRPFILSDSFSIGGGHYAGHWEQLNGSWADLRYSVSRVLQMGIQGTSMSGLTACGFGDNELCLRSFQLSAFFPLFQVYEDSAQFLLQTAITREGFLLSSIRSAVSRRYELLPYLYTLIYEYHAIGTPPLRPLFFEFPHDNETYFIDGQFMWGSALMISPILEKNASELKFYLPKGAWYNFYQGDRIPSDGGEWLTERGGPLSDFKQPLSLHVRAGHIIALQKPSLTLHRSRGNSLSLLVALDPDSGGASGMLYWDDGYSKDSVVRGQFLLVDMTATRSSVIVNGELGRRSALSRFSGAIAQQVRILGLHRPPSRIVIDGQYTLSMAQQKWNEDTQVLDLKNILIPLARKTYIEWFY